MGCERKTSISIGFTTFQLNALDTLASQSGSIAEHVRKAVDDYLVKMGINTQKIKK